MLKDKKLFLFDIDGTIAIGDTLYEGSRELLDYIEVWEDKPTTLPIIPQKAMKIM